MTRSSGDSSGLARLIRYESCATVARTRVLASASVNAVHSSPSQTRSAHRFAIFVKICITVAPIARARGGASRVPPAIETCAPRSTSSSHTGAIQLGSFALSVFGLNAGRFFATAAFDSDFSTAAFSGAVFFFAVDFDLRFELGRLAMKCLPAAWAVNRARLNECEVELAPTRALAVERVVAADDAVSVVRVIRAKAAAHGAPLRDFWRHPES